MRKVGLQCSVFFLSLFLATGDRLPFVVRQHSQILLNYPINSTIALSNHVLEYVYEGSDEFFTYYDVLLADSMTHFQIPYSFEAVESASKICHNSVNIKKQYYSGDISNLEELNQIVTPGKLFLQEANLSGLSLNVWIGGTNITASPHYDGVHNIFVQLEGQKKVWLLSPKYLSLLYTHGRLHPHACQSRLKDLARGSYKLSSYSLSKESYVELDLDYDTSMVPVLEIILSAGDILYIPPYWIHQTKALSCSASLSFWWETHESEIENDLLDLPLPFEAYWTSIKLQQSFVHYILTLIAEIKQEDSTTSILILLKNRYLEDYDENQKRLLSACNEDDFPCAKFISYAKKTAAVLISNVRRYIQKNGDTLSKLNMESTDEVDYLVNGNSGDEDYISKVIALKACDFIEKVAIFVASMIDPDSNLASQTKDAVLYIMPLIYATEINH